MVSSLWTRLRSRQKSRFRPELQRRAEHRNDPPQFHLKFRRKPLYFGSSTSREIICSALIAKAFYKVNYPIQPIVHETGRGGSHAFRDRVTVRHPSYIMPRDFDLSANFEIVKHHLKGFESFDYRQLALF